MAWGGGLSPFWPRSFWPRSCRVGSSAVVHSGTKASLASGGSVLDGSGLVELWIYGGLAVTVDSSAFRRPLWYGALRFGIVLAEAHKLCQLIVGPAVWEVVVAVLQRHVTGCLP